MIGRSQRITSKTKMLMASYLILCLGCAAPNINPQSSLVLDRINESNKAVVDAVAPLFDIKGRSPSAQGRAIEESLARSSW